MDKRYLSPTELLNIATQHAYSADFLLRSAANVSGKKIEIETLLSITSLMYLAFQITLKAYCLHDHRPVKEYKNLMELVEMNGHLGLSSQELALLKTLSKQQAFNKGISYDLWDNEQELQVFCAKVMALYERLQELMPLELQSDYL